MSDLSRLRPPLSQVDEPADDASVSQMELGRGKESWFFLKSSIGFLAGAILCMVAALVLMYLTSRHVGMDLPWSDDALDLLFISTTLLAGAHLVLKLLALLTDRHGQIRRPKKDSR